MRRKVAGHWDDDLHGGSVRDEDATRFTKTVREDLLRIVSPRKTQHLPSFLPLHIGMRLLLFSKECVRFGLMNGCKCILGGIVFAENEELPAEAVA